MLVSRRGPTTILPVWMESAAHLFGRADAATTSDLAVTCDAAAASAVCAAGLAVRQRSGVRMFPTAPDLILPQIERVAYWDVLGAVAMILLSGIAIWKPVQTYPLETLFGGFQGARVVHFVFMTAIALFIIIHVALVILVPKTFLAMTLGRAIATPHRHERNT